MTNYQPPGFGILVQIHASDSDYKENNNHYDYDYDYDVHASHSTIGGSSANESYDITLNDGVA